jgi:CheY-like chemotaxis protein
MSRSLPKAQLRPKDLASLKVLVVDDNTNVLCLVGDVLRAGGVGQVETANDGVHAHDMIARWDPDIIFADWRMPRMNGLDLTRSIRRAAVTGDRRIPNPAVPVIILTGNRSEADVEEARRAGVDEFVIKPFTPAGLLSRIQLVLAKPRDFIVGEDFVGPDRRRRAGLTYNGLLRRITDPEEVADEVERAATRDTISVELEALRVLIATRGGVDRETLKMTYRVMQHTSYRARQVRDALVQKASDLLLAYVEAMGGSENCDPEVLDVHFRAISTILELDPDRSEDARDVVVQLEAVVKRKVAKRQRLLRQQAA